MLPLWMHICTCNRYPFAYPGRLALTIIASFVLKKHLAMKSTRMPSGFIGGEFVAHSVASRVLTILALVLIINFT